MTDASGNPLRAGLTDTTSGGNALTKARTIPSISVQPVATVTTGPDPAVLGWRGRGAQAEVVNLPCLAPVGWLNSSAVASAALRETPRGTSRTWS